MLRLNDLPAELAVDYSEFLDTLSKTKLIETNRFFAESIKVQPPQIIVSFANLKRCIELGATLYRQPNMTLMGDRDGLLHGKVGRVRAQKVLDYAQKLKNEDEELLLALLVAIYKPGSGGFFDVARGRSSRLAGLIADRMIQGDLGHRREGGEIKTVVFDKNITIKAAYNINNCRVAHKFYFDPTKGVRSLVRLALLCEDKVTRERIEFFAKKFELFIDNGKFESIDLSLLSEAEVEMMPLMGP